MKSVRLILLLFVYLMDFALSDGFVNFRLMEMHRYNESYPSMLMLCIGLRPSNSEDRSKDCSLVRHKIFLRKQPDNIHEIVPFKVKWPTEVPLFVSVSVISDGEVAFFKQEKVNSLNKDNGTFIIKTLDRNISLSYSLSITCAQNFYGSGCSSFCQQTSQVIFHGRSHYTCSQQGTRTCVKGWHGRLCDQPICEQACVNGQCVSPNSCRCSSGWQGPDCSTCVPRRGCANGFCTKANECICEKNWNGLLCDRKIDICSSDNPCFNGRCLTLDDATQYFCNCTLGYHGRHCNETTTTRVQFPTPSLEGFWEDNVSHLVVYAVVVTILNLLILLLCYFAMVGLSEKKTKVDGESGLGFVRTRDNAQLSVYRPSYIILEQQQFVRESSDRMLSEESQRISGFRRSDGKISFSGQPEASRHLLTPPPSYSDTYSNAATRKLPGLTHITSCMENVI